MSKKSGSQTPTKARKAAAIRKSSATVRRRTRMIALEPRMLFDGALGVDLAAQATAVAEAPPAAEVRAPAATEAPVAEAALAKPADGATDRTAAQALATPTEPNEIVFVDARVKDYQGALQGVDPKAAIIFLDAGKDGVAQIAD